MHKSFLIILLVCSTLCSMGQDLKKEDYLRSCKNDTAAYNERIRLQKELSLPNLITSRDSSHFRYWPGHYAQGVIDVWMTDKMSVSGTLKLYIFGRPASKKNGSNRSKAFYQNYILNPDTAKIIYQLLASLNEIPTADSIPHWNDWMINDGYGDDLEYATLNHYQRKGWDNPKARDSAFQFAKQVVDISEKIYQVLNWEPKWKSLVDQLPDGSYGYGMISMTKRTTKTVSAKKCRH